MCEPAVVRTLAVQNKSLMPSGKPSSAPPCPFASLRSDARAMSQARSGVGSTKALSARARSIAVRCASVSSIAENCFARRPSRACARVSAVRSVIRRSDRHTKTGFWPQRPLALPRCRPPRASARPIRPASATAAPENLRTVFPPPPDRRGSISRGSRDKPARWRLVRRPGTWLFHHLGEVDEVQDRVELALQTGNLVLGNGDSRQVRNAADRICVDSHKQLLSTSPVREPIVTQHIADAIPRSQAFSYCLPRHVYKLYFRVPF